MLIKLRYIHNCGFQENQTMANFPNFRFLTLAKVTLTGILTEDQQSGRGGLLHVDHVEFKDMEHINIVTYVHFFT
jgi:hypothetical protein